ncbi:antibiotic biosynthesis monooxygenase [Muricauda sp. JGD-17]|uniref:Antibiotic biosynthesis monooxygenase n=1 Tax=Flagellimonas ochracea TaxID=2696472 RepID=A0A964TCD5_9FLAO|nr:antibiotic biosynthesis monooxygenase [Allomuricauda ochracea]NAY92299.1 antibiotic biosynthesis monooxygenase [Allomuricauda ochracea]
MISRIWHGYTTKDNADVYENLLKTEIFPGIEKKNITGYKGIQLLRRELDNEVEFITIMWFENMKSVTQFVGKNPEKVYVPEKACQVLSRFDNKSSHYELRHQLEYGGI